MVAIERAGKVIIPRGDDVILSDDLAYVVTRGENIDLVVEHFGLQSQPVRNLVVVGGGSIGRLVAQWARERGIKIRIIEKNEARCEALVDQLEDVTVLNGDGTDLSLLEEENVGAADVFAAVTDDEEDNVLIALLGRKMGARRTIARVAHLGYVPWSAPGPGPGGKPALRGGGRHPAPPEGGQGLGRGSPQGRGHRGHRGGGPGNQRVGGQAA